MLPQDSFNYGGGVYNSGSLTLSRSAVVENTASGRRPKGAGLYNTGTAGLTNVTVCGNGAIQAGGSIPHEGSGGGIHNVNTLTLSFSTVTNNLATAGYPATGFSNVSVGGGVTAESGSTTTIGNSIVAGNTGTDYSSPFSWVPGSSPDVAGAVTSAGYNVIGQTDGSTGWVGADQTGTSSAPLDPVLGPLQNNGGPAIGDPGIVIVAPTHEVLPGSPALLAADPSAAPATDQRGSPRNPAAPTVGAYESSLAQFLFAPGSGGGPLVAYSGSPFDLTVTAADLYGKRVYTYQGTVTFDSTDSSADLPANTTFGASDAGVITFYGVELNTLGAQSITVEDLTDPTKFGDVEFEVY